MATPSAVVVARKVLMGRPFLRLPRAARRGTGSGWLPVGGQDLVRVGARRWTRVGVDERGGQPGNCVQQRVLRARAIGGVDDRGAGGVDDFASACSWCPVQRSRTRPGPGRQVSPAGPVRLGRPGPGRRRPSAAGRSPVPPSQDGQDRHGDQQADDRVGPVPAEGDPAGAEKHREGGEAVGAGVQPVGDQRSGTDLRPTRIR